jgi:DNA-binding PadR family transcriptional regulator
LWAAQPTTETGEKTVKEALNISQLDISVHMSGEELASDMVRSSILILLYEKPLHGYAIMSGIMNRLGKPVSPSLVYPFLSQLEEKGLVKSSMKPVGRKPRKIYELTEEGCKLTTRLFKRLASLVSIVLEPSLTICAHCGAKIFEGGHKEVIDGKEVMFCCVHCCGAFLKEAGQQKASHTHVKTVPAVSPSNS